MTEKLRPLSSMLASAQRITEHRSARTAASKTSTLQEDAWSMFELVGELRFIVETLADRLAQARLFVGELQDDPDEAPVPVDDPALSALLESIGGGPVGRVPLVTKLAVNLFVPGEAFLVGVPSLLLPSTLRRVESLTVEPLTGPQDYAPQDYTPPGFAPEDLTWFALSTSELAGGAGGEVTISLGETQDEKLVVREADVVLIRVWKPHPKKSWQAHSPTLSVLPVLKKIVGLDMRDSAQIDSRLAGAGLFIVPQTAQRAMQAAANLPEGSSQDVFTEALIEAMLTPVSDRASASALVPLVATVPDEAAALFQYIDFAKALDAQAGPMMDTAIRRFALGMNAPPELLLGTAGMNHWGCVDEPTEILTEHGWVTHDRLVPGDVILTLNHDTGMSEWQPVMNVLRYDVTDEPMTLMEGYGHSSLTTWNHRWPVTSANHDRREFVVTKDLNTGHRIPMCAPHADLPTTAKHADSFVELVGWFWTEGWVSKTDGQSCIAQSDSANPEKVTAIRRALTESFPGRWGFESRQKGEWGSDVIRFNLRGEVRDALLAVGGKYPTPAFVQSLTASQLELFIATSCAGDGWHDNRGELDIWQLDSAALDAYELALILSGRAVAHSQHAGGEVVNAYNKTTVRPVKAARAPNGRMSIVEQDYTGTIWCPQVTNSTWLARRNGTVWFTGNSWLIQDDVVSTHLEPPLALMCDALTTQYLWPVLMDGGMLWERARRYVVWFDTSDLVARPNRSTDAMELHARGVIGDEALRDETGFDASQAPFPEESLPVEVMMAMEWGKANPALIGTPGLPAVARQIKDLLSGEWETAPPPPVTVPPATPGAPPSDGQPQPEAPVPPGGNAPQTQGEPPQQPPVGNPAPAVAASVNGG